MEPTGYLYDVAVCRECGRELPYRSIPELPPCRIELSVSTGYTLDCPRCSRVTDYDIGGMQRRVYDEPLPAGTVERSLAFLHFYTNPPSR